MTTQKTVKKLLVVEDEEDINEIIVYHLTSAGYRVTSAHDGEVALDKLKQGRFDLIILDILLPGMDGWQVCRHIRNSSNASIPLIFLTALSDEPDRVRGFDLGCDDYLSKPFSPRELVSRVNALLRRTEDKPVERTALKRDNMTIDFLQHQIRLKGRPVHLTNSEFRLLQLLASHEGRVFSRDELLRLMREDNVDLELGNVDVHVHHLRQKIEENPKKPRFIKTVWGVGYQFDGS